MKTTAGVRENMCSVINNMTPIMRLEAVSCLLDDFTTLESALAAANSEREALAKRAESMRAIFEVLRNDIDNVLGHRNAIRSGGVQCNDNGGVLGSVPPSTLSYLDRLCRDALLAESANKEEGT